ncbi:LOW QUALITY PROTEIN: endoplasmic reticulum-Golgi intermediate compartment protein 2-like [Drosophila rhopaloa]|uniref:Endoplasmic reticulum-Golgi intermediate compartment protein 2 n=1 Tax=Drosophila rhopaloa TaxID=1041015 RepID=A0ABM5H6L4_DRORH|nr:LOW QUALITY PROTEIN: endoplasmic reticulum-Golgi intermediate compartment protein 2-like [Drosophila rhopaloa]
MTATLRYRGDKSNLLELAKNLDAFKKVPEKYTETTEIGGTLSLLSRLLIVYLVYTELHYYWHETDIVYQFEPDIALDEQEQMHVDITVAMPCASLSGVDLMDETQQDVFAYGTLQREGVWWEMSQHDRLQFHAIQIQNHYLREQFHSVADVLFKDIMRDPHPARESPSQMPAAPPPGALPVVMDLHLPNGQNNGVALPENKFDACRLHGTLGINKVAGVLYLVGEAQPVVGLFEDRWINELRRMPANFRHRINGLSFGQYSRRIVQPLEGDETVIHEVATTVQYFLKVVPTEIHQTFSTINTFQYAVTENVRKLDSERNSYGSPGIYFKYDWSALKIMVGNDHLVTFAIRLCSIISGIIVISGAINSLLLGIQRRLLRTFAPEMYQRLTNAKAAPPAAAAAPLSISAQAAAAPPVNELLHTANLMANVDISAYLPTAPPKLKAGL